MLNKYIVNNGCSLNIVCCTYRCWALVKHHLDTTEIENSLNYPWHQAPASNCTRAQFYLGMNLYI